MMFIYAKSVMGDVPQKQSFTVDKSPPMWKQWNYNGIIVLPS